MARPVPADLEDALAANRAARDRFWAMPPEQKDAWVGWVDRARMPGARRRRIAQAVHRLSGPTASVRSESSVVAVPRENAALAWVLGVAVLAALAAFLVWLTLYRHHHDSHAAAVAVSAKASVPKVTGIRVQSAQFQLRQAKLASKVERKAAAKPKGIVVGQSPKRGASVPQGTVVTLLVSKGRPGIGMPDLTGLAAADALKALQARGLSAKLEQITSTQPPGTVVEQSPKPGKRAQRGTQVVLQVSKAKASVSVPSVTGQSAQEASTALQHAGLRSTVATVPSKEANGTVVAQHPAAGSTVAQGSSVRLNVSQGATQSATTTAATTTATTAPPQTGNDYRGMRLSQAVQKIAQGRQQVIVQYVTSSQPAGVVVANSNAGSKVQLQISAGAHPQPNTSVPDTSGEDAPTAQHDLTSAGFSVLTVQWPVSVASSNGTVVYETPSGQAPKGSTVVVYVGAANG